MKARLKKYEENVDRGKKYNNTKYVKELLPTKSTKRKIQETKIDTSLKTALPAELVVAPEVQEAIIATCDKVGLTREKCITAINEALEATKMTLDKYGEEHVEPDHDKRLKASLAGLELRGDFKNKDAIKPTTYNTVIYQWKR